MPASRSRRFIAGVGLAALLVAAAFGIATGSAPAGNRDPDPTLVEYPGPGDVSYGENVGYTASLLNGPNQTSTYTHVVYHHVVPTTTLGGDSAAADLVYSSCEPGPPHDDWDDFEPLEEYACPALAQLRAGDTATVMLVWKAPGTVQLGDGITCDSALAVPPPEPINDCKLTSTGYWTIKEGTGNLGSAGPDTFFPPDEVETGLLGATTDLTKARGYVVNQCSSGSSLETSVVTPVGPTNKLFTRVCASSVPGATTNPYDPGLVVEIDEGMTSGPITDDVKICIPSPGQSCSNATYTPWTFTPRATFSFTIDNRTLPSGEKVDSVSHDSGDGNGYVPVTDDCTIKIVNSQKITIVTCSAAKNGSWRFG